MFRPGDLVTINGGSDNGIEVGQEYYVRRVQAPARHSMSRDTPATSEPRLGPRLRRRQDDVAGDDFTRLRLRWRSAITWSRSRAAADAPDANPPKPQRDNYGHILIGSDRRTMFAKNDFFTVDRGSDHGVTLGARFIIYRDKRRTETTKVR
jgi:hypothetical protein